MWPRLLIAAMLWLMAGPLGAAELPRPSGPVLVTVTGAIQQTNRGPYRPFQDALFAKLGVNFEKAAAFDLTMLERLSSYSVKTSYDSWPGVFNFEGPLLRDILKAVDARGSTVVVRGIDGYAAEIPIAELETYPVILALRRDGEYLGLGSHGPTWVIYPRDEYRALRSQDDSKWVWGVLSIDVR